jgi:bromodomain-containing factor 1
LCKLYDLLRRVLSHFPSRDKPAPASSPVVNSGTTAKQVNKSARPKKNKPMSATEQEERIAKLSRVRDQYRSVGGQAGTSPEAMDTVVAHGLADDSDEESDSEEE